MQLASFLERHPGTRLATAQDNARLLEFFEREPMHTSGFQVQYLRRPDFFALLRHQGERAYVLIGEDRRGALDAVATLSLRPAWIDGERTTVGSLGDLRVRFERNAVRRWRPLFADLLNHAAQIDELADCRHWLAVILDANLRARRALAEQHDGQPALVPLATFTMRNLMLRLPLPRPQSGRLSVREAQPTDRDELSRFFEAENRRLPFGFDGEFARRLACWQGLSIEDFVYASDERGIVGCVAPWSASPVKQTRLSRIPAALSWLGRAAALLPGGPLRVPRGKEPLRTAYLSHLTFAERLDDDARRTVFRAMLHRVFDRWRDADWHCLALCDFAAWGLGQGLREFLQHAVPITLYAVMPPGQARPASGAAARPTAVGFEMAVV